MRLLTASSSVLIGLITCNGELHFCKLRALPFYVAAIRKVALFAPYAVLAQARTSPSAVQIRPVGSRFAPLVGSYWQKDDGKL